MNRHCLDPRVWLPIAAAAICFSLRPLPEPPDPGGPAARPVDLPPIRAAGRLAAGASYVLDPGRSSVRFLVEGTGGELLASCPKVRGRLRVGSPDQAGQMELVLDLGALQPLDSGAHTPDPRRLLGVHRDSTITYHATLVRSSTSPVPAVTQLSWLGTLRIGGHTVRQPMDLWQCVLPGQPLRLQGCGTVSIDDYGMPRRTWFGILHERHVVTLGLDLAWKRERAN